VECVEREDGFGLVFWWWLGDARVRVGSLVELSSGFPRSVCVCDRLDLIIAAANGPRKDISCKRFLPAIKINRKNKRRRSENAKNYFLHFILASLVVVCFVCAVAAQERAMK